MHTMRVSKRSSNRSVTSVDVMTPHLYHSNAPAGGRGAHDVGDGRRKLMLTLNLHERHCVMPLTGPNVRLDSTCVMVRGKTSVVEQPRGHVEGTNTGVMAGSADGGASVTTERVATTEVLLADTQSSSSS